MAKKQTLIVNPQTKVSHTTNKAIAAPVSRESELTLSQELELLTGSLDALTSSETLNLPKILTLVDVLGSTTKIANRQSRLFSRAETIEFQRIALETLSETLKQHRKRFGLAALKKALLEILPPDTEDDGLTKALVLLRRLQAYAGTDNPNVTAALAGSAKKLIPIIREQKQANNELLTSKQFAGLIIRPTIEIVNDHLNKKFNADDTANIISSFTTNLAAKLEN